MSYRWIDLESYPRRAHFEYFSGLASPHVGVTVEVDVTRLTSLCKARGASFYLAFMHAAALAADAVPELRQRLRDGGIVEYDACPTSHVEPLPDGTYCYCTLRHGRDWDDYFPYAEEVRRQCRENASIEEDEDVEGMYFITALPWLHYTAFTQPVAGPKESNPRISWGRYDADAKGRLMMPVTLLVHHALVDGLQMADFYRNLEARLEAL